MVFQYEIFTLVKVSVQRQLKVKQSRKGCTLDRLSIMLSIKEVCKNSDYPPKRVQMFVIWNYCTVFNLRQKYQIAVEKFGRCSFLDFLPARISTKYFQIFAEICGGSTRDYHFVAIIIYYVWKKFGTHLWLSCLFFVNILICVSVFV